jgi:hypothetical protein
MVARRYRSPCTRPPRARARAAAARSRGRPRPAGVGPSGRPRNRDNDAVKLWHKHKWGQWERAWGKGSAKGYVLERKCSICGKTQTQVIR